MKNPQAHVIMLPYLFATSQYLSCNIEVYDVTQSQPKNEQ